MLKYNKHIPGIDHIRAYSAILVLLFHVMTFLPPYITNKPNLKFHTNNLFVSILAEGNIAVVFFFIISGFLFYTICNNRKINYKKFIKSRFLRIYPLYLFLIFIGMSSEFKQFNLSGFFKLLLGLSNMFNQNNLQTGRIIGGHWAIGIELYFYIIFPFLLVILKKKSDYFKFIFMMIFFRTIIYFTTADLYDVNYYTLVGRIDQFVIGMLLARIYLLNKSSKNTMKKIYLFIISLFLLLLLTFFKQVHLPKITQSINIILVDIESLICAFVIWSYLINFNINIKFLKKISDLSYSIYLTHWGTLFLVIKMNIYFNVSKNYNLNALFTGIFLVIPLTILLSYLTYTFIEKPFLDIKIRYLES